MIHKILILLLLTKTAFALPHTGIKPLYSFFMSIDGSKFKHHAKMVFLNCHLLGPEELDSKGPGLDLINDLEVRCAPGAVGAPPEYLTHTGNFPGWIVLKNVGRSSDIGFISTFLRTKNGQSVQRFEQLPFFLNEEHLIKLTKDLTDEEPLNVDENLKIFDSAYIFSPENMRHEEFSKGVLVDFESNLNLKTANYNLAINFARTLYLEIED